MHRGSSAYQKTSPHTGRPHNNTVIIHTTKASLSTLHHRITRHGIISSDREMVPIIFPGSAPSPPFSDKKLTHPDFVSNHAPSPLTSFASLYSCAPPLFVYTSTPPLTGFLHGSIRTTLQPTTCTVEHTCIWPYRIASTHPPPYNLHRQQQETVLKGQISAPH